MSLLASEESLPIEFKEKLPEAIQKEFDSISEPGEDIQMTVSSDMNLEGNFEESWLLATNRRILVFSSDNEMDHRLIHEVPLADIDKVELKNYVGNGILEVKTADRAIELLRFSRTALHRNGLAEVPKAIDRLLERIGQGVDERRAVAVVSERDRSSEHGRIHRCEKCGNIIPFWTDTCPHCLEKGTLLARLFGYLKPYWHLAVIAFILLISTVALSRLVPPVITKQLMDRVFKPIDPTTDAQRFHLLGVYVLALIGAHILSTGLGTIRTYMMQWMGNKIVLDLRTSAYEYLQRLSLSFYNKKETGRLMSRISYDTGNLQDFIVNGIQEFLRSIFELIGMCVILFVMNWRLAALTLIPIPTLIVGSVIFGKKMHIVYHKVWRRMAGISAILADTIPGVRVVKAFVAEDREVDRFNDESEEYFKSSMRAAKLSTIYFPIMGFATFAGGIIVRWFGGRDVITEKMTLGGLMLFMSYMYQFYEPIQSLTRLNHSLQRAAAAAERVFEILDAQPEIQDKKDAIELPAIRGDIKFDNVFFSYDDEKNALDGISFDIKAGEMVGLSGPSGAGKTTLINLLGRFYDVTEGSVTIDGYNIKDLKVRSLRDQIGIVLQDPFLFHGSIADNIAYSKPNASRVEIIAAAKAANAHDFIIKFPDGYDTLLAERGGGLSGGEKQRISIARAILKNPRILILDEATSSVDTETESLIQSAIERLVKGRTTFAIAHRLSTLRKADKLIILDKGKIPEMGTHDELLDNNGLYRRLVDMQSELSKVKAI